MKRKKVRVNFKQVALDLRSAAKKVWKAALSSKFNLVILALQLVTIYRIEKLSDKIDALGMGIAQSLVILYMNIVFMMNELAAILEKVLAIVMGNPA